MFLIPKPKILPPLIATIHLGQKTLSVYWQDGVVMNLSSLWFQQSDEYVLDSLDRLLPKGSYCISNMILTSAGGVRNRADRQSYYELADMMWSDFASTNTTLCMNYSISASIRS